MMGKGIWKILAFSVVLAIVASSVAIHSPADLEKGISEGCGKGVISLMPPPFIGVAGAVEVMGGNAFPEDEAGISAYVNVGKSINITEAVKAFTQIEELSQTHAIGIIPIDNKRGTVNVHVYLDTGGYIVAYFKNTEPASKIIKWSGMDFSNPKIEDFITNTAIKAMCTKIDVYYLDIKDDIKYYDFEYPDAKKMVIFLDARSSGGDEYTHIFIPGKYRLYEASYSVIAIYTSHTYYYSQLYVDGRVVVGEASSLTMGTYNLENVLTVGEPHTIKLYTRYCKGGVGTILIYKER
jgi:hypothetical protein